MSLLALLPLLSLLFLLFVLFFSTFFLFLSLSASCSSVYSSPASLFAKFSTIKSHTKGNLELQLLFCCFFFVSSSFPSVSSTITSTSFKTLARTGKLPFRIGLPSFQLDLLFFICAATSLLNKGSMLKYMASPSVDKFNPKSFTFCKIINSNEVAYRSGRFLITWINEAVATSRIQDLVFDNSTRTLMNRRSSSSLLCKIILLLSNTCKPNKRPNKTARSSLPFILLLT